MAATALRLELICGRCPRVARASQSRDCGTLGRNPVGIRHGPEQKKRGRAKAGRTGGADDTVKAKKLRSVWTVVGRGRY